ncbi:hypothetical protein PGT21_024052 [Puccinia graminis f. sp. tritici]|uniref:Uncharacterized protein n=1 Tax=Puccinia graminis f. sp. tritici TaxID=56615 RepID=A0A5B0R1E9_PUCGR|nr:hypothetical protein PGT21_024052 [Puccinia graminis f. sp. tritici]
MCERPAHSDCHPGNADATRLGLTSSTCATVDTVLTSSEASMSHWHVTWCRTGPGDQVAPPSHSCPVSEGHLIDDIAESPQGQCTGRPYGRPVTRAPRLGPRDHLEL